jgi:hypothetical protein
MTVYFVKFRHFIRIGVYKYDSCDYLSKPYCNAFDVYKRSHTLTRSHALILYCREEVFLFVMRIAPCCAVFLPSRWNVRQQAAAAHRPPTCCSFCSELKCHSLLRKKLAVLDVAPQGMLSLTTANRLGLHLHAATAAAPHAGTKKAVWPTKTPRCLGCRQATCCVASLPSRWNARQQAAAVHRLPTCCSFCSELKCHLLMRKKLAVLDVAPQGMLSLTTANRLGLHLHAATAAAPHAGTKKAVWPTKTPRCLGCRQAKCCVASLPSRWNARQQAAAVHRLPTCCSFCSASYA